MPEILVGQCHGGWTPADKFVAIPANTKLFLFQNPGELMDDWFADWHNLQLASTLQARQAAAKWTLIPDDIVYDYHTEPLGENDYTSVVAHDADGNEVRTLDILQGPSAEGVEIVKAGMKLSEVLRDYKGNNIYWLACQAYAAEKSDEELKMMLNPANVKIV